MKLVFLLISIIWLTSVSKNNGARILFLGPIGSKSHKIFFMAINEALAERGHEITMLSGHKPFKVVKNIREIVVNNAQIDEIVSSAFDTSSQVAMNLIQKTPKMCVDTLALKEVQDLKKEKFDMIIISVFMNFCYLSFVDHFQVPFAYAFSASLIGSFNDIMNNIDFPSLAPNRLLTQNFPMSFVERLSSTAVLTLVGAAFKYSMYRSLEECKERKLCRQDMGSVQEISNNASIAIVNSFRGLDYPPRPLMPNIIQAGGIHCKPSKPLPKDIEEWVNASGKNGFIFFSLGSALDPATMPEKNRQLLLKVFGSLKQRVLWKWSKEKMENLPSNVKIGKWFPQQDILGHPKLKLFITHGGLGSMLESTYFKAPVLVIPLFADQFFNAHEAETEGWAAVMHWKGITEKGFREKISNALTNTSMKAVISHRSSLMRDVPISPAHEAVFWIEYVLRHKGAKHLMSPVRHLTWIEVYNMDVWALIVSVILLIFYIFYALTKCMLNMCFSSKYKKSKRE